MKITIKPGGPKVRTTTAVAFTCTYTDGNGTNAHQDSIMFSVAVFGE